MWSKVAPNKNGIWAYRLYSEFSREYFYGIIKILNSDMIEIDFEVFRLEELEKLSLYWNALETQYLGEN